jgi:hypothetical protein
MSTLGPLLLVVVAFVVALVVRAARRSVAPPVESTGAPRRRVRRPTPTPDLPPSSPSWSAPG